MNTDFIPFHTYSVLHTAYYYIMDIIVDQEYNIAFLSHVKKMSVKMTWSSVTAFTLKIINIAVYT